MQDYLDGTGVEAFSSKYMKKKLKEQFGDQILVITIINRANLFTFTRTEKAILHDFYCPRKNENAEDEKQRPQELQQSSSRVKSRIQIARIIQTQRICFLLNVPRNIYQSY